MGRERGSNSNHNHADGVADGGTLIWIGAIRCSRTPIKRIGPPGEAELPGSGVDEEYLGDIYA